MKHFAVSPRGDVLWWLKSDNSEEGRWYEQQVDGGAARLLDQVPATRSDGGVFVTEAGGILGIARDNKTEIYCVRDGEARVLGTYPPMAQASSVSADGRYVAVSHSAPGETALSKEVDVLDTETGERVMWLPAMRPAMFRWTEFPREPGDCRLLHQTEVDGNIGLAIRDIRHPDAEERVVDTRNDAFRDADLEGLWLPGGQELLVTADRDGRTLVYRYDLTTRAVAPALPLGDELSVERVARSGTLGLRPALAVRPDGRILAQVSGPQVATHFVDDHRRGRGADRGRTESSMTRHLRVPRAKGGPPEIPVLVSEPPGPRPDGGHPVVFLTKGGPVMHDTMVHNPLVQALVEQGLAVVQVQYRGSTGNGLAWIEAMTADPVIGQVADLQAVHRHLAEDGVVDPERLVVLGRSWSGGMALHAAATIPGVRGVGAFFPVAKNAGVEVAMDQEIVRFAATALGVRQPSSHALAPLPGVHAAQAARGFGALRKPADLGTSPNADELRLPASIGGQCPAATVRSSDEKGLDKAQAVDL
ncbi:MAG: prolyl oligopeptidase family serine peptidase [Streptomycetaceae bacterium]|nr:prolyl oligopeptidase family serine peptidase [Streptomycetaceae bacterium]